MCTSRGQGPGHGASAAPYAFFNLGDHVGDAPQAVAANRGRLAHALQARPVFMQQVHGVQVLRLDAATPDGCEADAAVTCQPGLACTVLVADCLPLLLTDRCGQAVAAVHAGWRGLAAGVIEQTVAALLSLTEAASGSAGAGLMAWLGPCIGPQVFEVGPEVRAVFVVHDAQAGHCFRAHGADRWLADLPGLARQRLRALGVQDVHGNDGSPDWCTVQQPAQYHSYRRDQLRLGGSGRMAACIWRE